VPIFRPHRKGERRASSGSLSKVPLNTIRRSLLDSVLACGDSALPNEFGAMLRSEVPGVITDLVLLPGTTAGHRHANLQLWMLPADFTIVGTVHSHPSGALHPSEADVQLFRHWGNRHLIIGRPFTKGCWRAYDGRGEEVHMDVEEDVQPGAAGLTPRRYEPPARSHTGPERRPTFEVPPDSDEP
jgi:proteasome lid subunit RPN8/RPN11